MVILYCAVIGYLIGCINPSFIIGLIKGFDIRKRGSGNAGASNALITLGPVFGVFCALFDIGKAYGAYHLCNRLFSDVGYAAAVGGAFVVIGHIFPFYMKFKGGKGLASIAGVILAFDWRIFLIALAAEIVIVLITDYICFVSITAALLLPSLYIFTAKPIISITVTSLAALCSLYRHIENIKRIKSGTEMRFSYLWNKEKEKERVSSSK